MADKLGNFEGRPVLLKDGRRFFAEYGFGCDPACMGTKVFGYLLDEPMQEPQKRTWIRRSDVAKVLAAVQAPETA